MEGLLAAIALALLDSDRLRRTVEFDSVEVQVETGDFLQAIRSLNELHVSHQLHLTRYLEAKCNRIK